MCTERSTVSDATLTAADVIERLRSEIGTVAAPLDTGHTAPSLDRVQEHIETFDGDVLSPGSQIHSPELSSSTLAAPKRKRQDSPDGRQGVRPLTVSQCSQVRSSTDFGGSDFAISGVGSITGDTSQGQATDSVSEAQDMDNIRSFGSFEDWLNSLTPCNNPQAETPTEAPQPTTSQPVTCALSRDTKFRIVIKDPSDSPNMGVAREEVLEVGATDLVQDAIDQLRSRG